MSEVNNTVPDIWFNDDEWKPEGARIKWKKCVDCYRVSHCGKWEIETIEWYNEPNDYRCSDLNGDGWEANADDLKEAKRKCEERLRIDICNGDREKAHDMMIDDGYEPDDREFMMQVKDRLKEDKSA